ncbi:RING-H2 finger protein ATL2 [Malania oleifera]|uniref:RING-H2 finger protein ATL2 n=1 Tax=Malania oleifera TaxID=397392 RepID=UPI0025AE4EEA|nr:RING-H2 finger protein ATL2 [Malania oleifera]
MENEPHWGGAAQSGGKVPQDPYWGRAENGGYQPKNYALSGKIMLSAIVILFAVILLMAGLHIYARWYLLRARRRHLHLRRTRRRPTHLVFYVEPSNPDSAARGLDPTLLKSLPVFAYSPETHPDPIDCAVCLSEFDEGEAGRRLPKCNHSFHVECIDMWFHSHSTCPLCRTPVEPVTTPARTAKDPPEIAVSVVEPTGSSSEFCSTCRIEEVIEDPGRLSSSSAATATATTAASFGARRKPLGLVGVTIEVPRRNGSFGRSEDETPSPVSASAFKSPGSRILRRILSRDVRAILSPSSVPSCSGFGSELDLERGREETALTRARTPR